MSKKNYPNNGQYQFSSDNNCNHQSIKQTQQVHNLPKHYQMNEQNKNFNNDQRNININNSKNNNNENQYQKSNNSNPNNNQNNNYDGYTDQNDVIENIIKSKKFQTKIEEYLKYSDILNSIHSDLNKHETEIKRINENKLNIREFDLLLNKIDDKFSIIDLESTEHEECNKKCEFKINLLEKDLNSLKILNIELTNKINEINNDSSTKYYQNKIIELEFEIQSIKKKNDELKNKNNNYSLSKHFQNLLIKSKDMINQKNIDISAKHLENKVSELDKNMNPLKKKIEESNNQIYNDSSIKHLENKLCDLHKNCEESIQKFYYESSIKILNMEGELLSADNFNDLKNLIGGSKKLTLKYKAKNQNFSCSKFHDSLQNLKKIIVMIKTKDCLFGIYTSKNFDMNLSIGKYIKDNKAFIFTFKIKNQKNVFKFPVNLRHSSSAIFVDSNIFFALGEGYDLYIPNKCDENFCTANFPNSYGLNDEKIKDFPNAFINGEEKFKIIDLEAYHVETFYSN